LTLLIALLVGPLAFAQMTTEASVPADLVEPQAVPEAFNLAHLLPFHQAKSVARGGSMPQPI